MTKHNGLDIESLSTVTIDVSTAVREFLAEEPDFETPDEMYAYAANTETPISKCVQMYDVKERAGLVKKNLFSDGRTEEYNIGLAHVGYKHMPKINALPAYLPRDARLGVPVHAETRDGTECARRYLRVAVIGHVRRMLERLHANRVNVRREADVLVGLITQVVEEILEEK